MKLTEKASHLTKLIDSMKYDETVQSHCVGFTPALT